MNLKEISLKEIKKRKTNIQYAEQIERLDLSQNHINNSLKYK